MELKEIIARNLVSLRKKHNLTQNQLAEKISYSDNAISRWEHAELMPSIEVLEDLSKVYNIPIETFFKENATKQVENDIKNQRRSRLTSVLLAVALIWGLATIFFVYMQIFTGKTPWIIFLWAVPASCIALIPFSSYWGKHIYRFVVYSIFVWALLACFYVQYLSYNIWPIFILGVPIQVALSIWNFVKPKNKKQKNTL